MASDVRVSADPREKRTFRPDWAIADLAGERWGVVTTTELLARGHTHSSIARRRARGHLHRLFQGVWAVGHPNPPWEGQLLAAVKACAGDAWLSHYSACELWGFVERLDRVPDVTVVVGGVRQRRGIRVHKTARLADVDRREVDGIPVTSPARALIDLGSLVGPKRTRAALRRALGTGRVSPRQIGLALERYAGRRGARVVRQAFDLGAAPTKSERESDVLDVLLEGHLAHPDVNRPLVIAGRRLIPDFRWPEQRLILEVDSTAWHENPVARAEDRDRQALLEAHGETVLRVHWRDAVLQPSVLVARLTDAGAPSHGEGCLSVAAR
jgi:very-short-patch-repair endonuclease